MRETALITGASGGIGYELALIFGREGYDCVLIARRKEALEELAQRLQKEYGASARVIATDLSDPAAPAHSC